MSTSETLDTLRSRILANYPLLYLQTWEEQRWENELATLALELERGIVAWTLTDGPQPPLDSSEQAASDPLSFLDQLVEYPPDHLFLLKDFHACFSNPMVVRRLRDLTGKLASQNKTVLMIGPADELPIELRKDTVVVSLPLPGPSDLRGELEQVIAEGQKSNRILPTLSPDDTDRLVTAVLGLTTHEARRALSRAIWGRDEINDDVFTLLVSEKRHMVSGSDLLEFFDLDEGIQHVGGLGGLKEWLAHRAEAYSPRAAEQGVPMPRGVLLLGVQGCGKSLTARAVARMLSFPLIRLDASNLLSRDVGASERNMRDVLHLVETVAPAVLWVDEIEKGFAGGAETGDGAAAQDAVMARLIGRFLMWMEDHKQPVFVVATANTVRHLPPELLRRGRFDEMFFVDLPNYEERKEIFEIHLSRRGWNVEKYDLEELANLTEGFSGSEIEQIVVSAMVESYGTGRVLRQQDLLRARDATVPLSITMEERIFELREWARERCRPATPDSRVAQMLDAEHRRGDLFVSEDDEAPRWKELAEHGQLRAAMVEFVRHSDGATFPELQAAFADFMETEGDLGLSLRRDRNAILWVGLSDELAELFTAAITGRSLYAHRIAVEDHQPSGLKIPALTDVPESRLDRPHWLPVKLYNLPPEGGSGPLARVARIRRRS